MPQHGQLEIFPVVNGNFANGLMVTSKEILQNLQIKAIFTSNHWLSAFHMLNWMVIVLTLNKDNSS